MALIKNSKKEGFSAKACGGTRAGNISCYLVLSDPRVHMLLLFSSFGLLANSSWNTRSWRGSWRSVQRTQESWNPNGSKQKEVLGLIYPNSFGSQRSKQTFPMSCSMFMGYNALNLLSSVAEKGRPLIRFIWSVECFFSLLIWMRDGHFKTMKFHIIIQKKISGLPTLGSLTFLTSSCGWSWVAMIPCLHSPLHSQLSHTQLGSLISITVMAPVGF